MSQELDDARTKVWEAHFFLKLMKRVENSRVPLMQGNPPLKEYTACLDGFWNACYSATHYYDLTNPKLKESFRVFRKTTQKDFYAWGTGKRSIAVHEKPVEPKREGYRPPHGDSVNFTVRQQNPPNGNEITFELIDYYYFTDDPSEQPITMQCEDRLLELEDFIMRNCS